MALAEEWGRDALLVGAGRGGALGAVAAVPRGLTCFVSAAAQDGRGGHGAGTGREEGSGRQLRAHPRQRRRPSPGDMGHCPPVTPTVAL